MGGLPTYRGFLFTDAYFKVTDKAMNKIYKSHTTLSFSVASGKRITFDELSGGRGSVFITGDESLQKEMESHPLFGYRFWLSEAQKESKKEEAQQSETVEVTVSDIGDAKEYLAEHFNISRTQLRTKDNILAAAKNNNVVFVGL